MRVSLPESAGSEGGSGGFRPKRQVIRAGPVLANGGLMPAAAGDWKGLPAATRHPGGRCFPRRFENGNPAACRAPCRGGKEP